MIFGEYTSVPEKSQLKAVKFAGRDLGARNGMQE
jgi:hypothetical protein